MMYMESIDEVLNRDYNERRARNRGAAAVGSTTGVMSVIWEAVDDQGWQGLDVAAEILNGNPEIVNELSQDTYGQMALAAAGAAMATPYALDRLRDRYSEEDGPEMPGHLGRAEEDETYEE